MDENKDFNPETAEEEKIVTEEETETPEEAVEKEPEEVAEEESAEPEEDNGENVEKSEEEKEEKSAHRPKKKAPFIVAAVAVLTVAIAVVISVVLSSPKTVFEKAVGFIEDGEYARVLDYTSKTQFYNLDRFANMTDDEKTEFVREDICGGFIDKVEAGSGLSVEITKITEHTEQEIEFARELFSNGEEDEIGIETLKGFTFNWVVEETGEKYEDQVYLIKEDGKWAVRWSV